MTEYDIPEVTDRDVYITRSFNAPIDVVWKFWTQAEYLAQWFGPHGISTPFDTIQVDTREGGSWNLTMKDDAGEYPIRATITKLVEPEYLELVMQSDTREGFLDNEILRIQFHDHGDTTRMTLHQGPFTPEFRDMTRDGWNESFLKLDDIFANTGAGA
jgi:uncharacterized protein YndB with AHSA1/START domain